MWALELDAALVWTGKSRPVAGYDPIPRDWIRVPTIPVVAPGQYAVATGGGVVEVRFGSPPSPMTPPSLSNEVAQIYSSFAASAGAGLVGAQRYVEGAFPRTLQDILLDSCSLMDFIPPEVRSGVRSGASNYDCSSALSAALAAASAVYVPEGRYIVGGVVCNGKTIYGPGTIVKKSSSPFAIKLDGERASVSKLRFSPMSSSGQPNADIKIGEGARHASVFECVFSNPTCSNYSAVCAADDNSVVGGDYPYATQAQGVSISRCVFMGYARPVFLLCVVGFRIVDNDFIGSSYDAVRVRETIGRGVISRNLFMDVGSPEWADEQTRDAIDTAFSGDRLIIADNIILRCAYKGLDIKGDDGSVGVADGYSSTKIVATGNLISDCRYSGVSVTATDASGGSILLADNIVERCNLQNEFNGGSVGAAAYYVYGNVKNVQVRGNQAISNHGRGFFVTSSGGVIKNLILSENISINNKDTGYYLSNIDIGVITSNIAENDNDVANAGAQTVGFSINADGSERTLRRLIVSKNIAVNHASQQIVIGQVGSRVSALAAYEYNIEDGPSAYGAGTSAERWRARPARRFFGTAVVPAADSGVFMRGDTIWDTAPTAGGKMGIVCIEGGSPGVWRPFGEIAE